MGSDVGSVRSFPYPTHNHRGLLAQGGLSGMFTHLHNACFCPQAEWWADPKPGVYGTLIGTLIGGQGHRTGHSSLLKASGRLTWGLSWHLRFDEEESGRGREEEGGRGRGRGREEKCGQGRRSSKWDKTLEERKWLKILGKAEVERF